MDRSLIERYAAGAGTPARGIQGLSREELNSFPIPGTWSIQQIIVHLMDSDLIGSDRMKRIAAEDNPLIISYNETRFAERLMYDRTDPALACELFALNRRVTADLLRRPSGRRLPAHRRTQREGQAYPCPVRHHLRRSPRRAHEAPVHQAPPPRQAPRLRASPVARSTKSSPAAAPSAETRIAVLHGPDPFLKDLHTQRLREALAQVHGADALEVVRFDGASAALADILDECRSYGLMQQHKFVVVDAADLLLKNDEDSAPSSRRTNREILQGYADAPSENATLVLRADRWYPGNLDKAVAKVGVVMKLEPPSPAEAIQWAIGRGKKRHGAVLTPDAAGTLIDAVGPDLGRIDTELAKLALTNPGQPITPDQVRELVGVTREESCGPSSASSLRATPPTPSGDSPICWRSPVSIPFRSPGRSSTSPASSTASPAASSRGRTPQPWPASTSSGPPCRR
jgi:hypothetical protein